MKKGGPEFVNRAPEGLSLFKITPQKACSFFAPWGARCPVCIYDLGYLLLGTFAMGQGPIIPKYKSLSIAVCFWYVLPLIHPSALCECLSSVGAASQVAAAREQCAVQCS